MRHWHRCDRWRRKGFDCPLKHGEDEEDEEEPEADETLRFERTPARTGVRVGSGKVARTSVGVREPRLEGRKKLSQTEVLEPAVPPTAADAIIEAVIRGVAPEVQVGLPRARGDVVGRASGGITTMGLERPAERPLPEAGTPENTAMAIGEMAVTTVARELAVKGITPFFPLFVMPFILELFRRAPALIRAIPPGLIGAPGRMDPARKASTFRPGSSPHRTAPAFDPVTKGVPKRPRVVPPSPPKKTNVPAGGGKQIDARTLLQGSILKTRRTVSPFRQADPNL